LQSVRRSEAQRLSKLKAQLSPNSPKGYVARLIELRCEIGRSAGVEVNAPHQASMCAPEREFAAYSVDCTFQATKNKTPPIFSGWKFSKEGTSV
jgi:hypothetical protein